MNNRFSIRLGLFRSTFTNPLLGFLILGWILLWAVLSASPALAVPAAPTLQTLAQPDGSTFKARQWGDEWNHGWETTEGYTILLDEASQYWTHNLRHAAGALSKFLGVVGQKPSQAEAAPMGKMLGVNQAQNADRQQAINIIRQLGGLNLPFITNVGQIDPRVRFYAGTLTGTVYVTHEGEIVYSLPPKDGKGGWALVERFKHDEKIIPAGIDSKVSRVSYIKNQNGRVVTHCASTFGSITLGEVFPGVRVDLRAHNRNVEKIYTVASGSDPTRIRMSLSGADSLDLDQDGNLLVATGNGLVRFSVPMAWQERDGRRVPVRVGYALDRDKYAYAFTVDKYDKSKELVIDPILQSTYLGGSSAESANSLAIHPTNGDIYVVGYSGSIDFPGVSGGADESCNNCPNLTEVFVARLSSDLTSILNATYLGGSGEDLGRSIAIHPTTGDVYVAGYANSIDFPGLAGGADTSRSLTEAFVSRLSYDLTTLIQSTFLGGNSIDVGHAISLHPQSGDVYVAGETSSIDFPGINSSSADVSCGSCSLYHDGFVARVSGDLKTIYQSTYLGGIGSEIIYALVIDPILGNVYVTGFTRSHDLPYVTGGADVNCTNCTLSGQPYFGEGFVARLSQSLQNDGNVQSTYLGGNAYDSGYAIAIHPDTDDIYVTGITTSFNFPGISAESADNVCAFPSCFEPPGSGGDRYEGFVSYLSNDLRIIKQSTYLGGMTDDYALALAIHSDSGDIYVTGATDSNDFPGITTDSADSIKSSFYKEAFVSQLAIDLRSIKQSTYFGGGRDDYGYSLAVHLQTGDIYIAGTTTSLDLPNISGGADEICDNCSMLNNFEAFASVFDNLSNRHQYDLTVSTTGYGTVTSNPAGINCGTDCSQSYNSGTTVTLTATPAADYTFTGWNGACSGTSITCIVAMNASMAVTATFTLNSYALTVSKAGAGGGTVTSTPAGIDCGSDCSESFNSGAFVTLTATPETGSTFSDWSGACSGAGGCVVTMDAAKSVIATFMLNSYPLTVTKSGTGSGTVTSNPAGIDCGSDCSENYDHGTTVTLIASASTGSTFTGWSGGCSGTGACVVTMDATQSVTATFALNNYTLTVTKAGTGAGTVTSSPAGINCGGTCSAAFTYGTGVTLTASPANGSTFAGWSGACTGTGVCNVTLNTNQAVQALFTASGVMTDRIGVKRGNQWYLDYNGSGTWNSGDRVYTFGMAGDLPLAGDWNGDGKAGIGVKRGTQWYLDYNDSGTWNSGDRVYIFGAAGDQPVIGDWNGDGKAGIGVKRGAQWYLDYNDSGTWNSGDRVYTFGAAGDLPLVGDWNGDGKADIGVKRGTYWYLDYNGSGTWNGGDRVYPFGMAGDIPVSGDWNGDGADKIGVKRGAQWYFDRNGNGAWNAGDGSATFGAAGDQPVIGRW